MAPPDRLRRDLVDLLNRTTDFPAFSLAARIPGRAVAFDGVCILTTVVRSGPAASLSDATGGDLEYALRA